MNVACSENMEHRSPLMVFSDDWGRHPSSCQHLIRHLMRRFPVCWVNTIGTRPPAFEWSTVARGVGKLRQWCRPRYEQANSQQQGPQVRHPVMWPWFRSSFDRWLNQKLLVRQLTKTIRAMPEAPVAITTIPIVADLVGHLPVSRWIYYCVDDFSQWPGLDQQTMQRLEEELLARVDRVIAVSEVLQRRVAGFGRSSSLLTHGVDLGFWTAKPVSAIPELEQLPRPLIVFFGLIDQRLDFEFVARLDAELAAGTILLVGPQADTHPRLQTLRRLVLWSALPYESLPALARAADVLIMPYADMPVTRAMQPLKLKEYLAAGKPAVVRNLPANREWADCLDLADDAASFARLVQRRVETGLPPEQNSARERLKNESWAAKSAVFERMLVGEEAQKLIPARLSC